MRCINIDWLECYVLERSDIYPMNADYFRSRGWHVEQREYGTRTYREMFVVYDTYGFPFVEVRRNPIGVLKNGQQNYSFEAYGAKLRLVNRYCYVQGCAALLAAFIEREGYTFSRISRVDLALDFIKFDSGDLPQRFIHRYVNGKYSKINQSNITAFGKDTWAGRGWNSLSWGSKKSAVFTRLYCKSLELDEVKDKPYIRQAWAAAGLVDNPLTCEKIGEDGLPYKPLVWRLEFAISSAVKNWVTIDDQMVSKQQKRSFRNTLDVYASYQSMLDMFASLALHFFHFKVYEEGKSKYKCPDKELFHFSECETFYKIDKVATAQPRSSLVQRLIKLLQAFNLSAYDREANKTAEALIYELQQYQLKHMANDPWDKKEVDFLRALLRIRIERHGLPIEQAKQLAHYEASIEATLWDTFCDEK